ncbi:11991_t:CDS:2, partial [Gigaspora rosea]
MSDSENSDYYQSTSTTKKLLPTRRAKTAKKTIIDIDSDISEDFSGSDYAPSAPKETTKNSKTKKKTQVIEEVSSSKTAKKSIFDVDCDNSEELSGNDCAPSTAKKSIFDVDCDNSEEFSGNDCAPS